MKWKWNLKSLLFTMNVFWENLIDSKSNKRIWLNEKSKLNYKLRPKKNRKKQQQQFKNSMSNE